MGSSSSEEDVISGLLKSRPSPKSQVHSSWTEASRGPALDKTAQVHP